MCRLALGAVGESDSVSADADMVSTQTGTLSQVVQQQYIQELPLNGRNAATLIPHGARRGDRGRIPPRLRQQQRHHQHLGERTRGNEVNYGSDGAPPTWIT